MRSSVGSDAFALLALLFISAFVLLLLRHFLPLRTTPAYLIIPVFLALALPFSIFLLVPIDLASSSGIPDTESKGIWLPDRVLLVAWRVAYWLTFALTWWVPTLIDLDRGAYGFNRIILPLLGEYIDSGYRSSKDRFLYSLRMNGRYQLIVLVCAGVGGIYIFLVNGFRTGSVKSLVMALAYCWGLVMAIYLMGHGLVAVPRRLFQNANHAGQLRRIQSRAPKLNDKLTDACMEFEELEAQLVQLRRRKNAVSRDHEEWIEDISDAYTMIQATPSTSATALPAVITDRYLAEFSRKLMRARHKRIRFTDAWNRLIYDAQDVQAILDASGSKKLDFGRKPPTTSLLGSTNFLTPYTRFLLYSKVVPAVRIFHGVIFSAASICIIWSELIKVVAPRLSIVSLTVLSYADEEPQIAFGGQAVASIWLLYMCMAALASFDDVKIWGNRALVKRNTYGESATWYATQVAKLTVPLAYNFITFLPKAVHQKSQFFHFLGALINLTPLGDYFDTLFPVFILVPVCATLFNLYGRAQKVLGFGMLEDDEENQSAFATGGWREGRDLIARELNGVVRLGLTGVDDTSSPVPSGVQSPLIPTDRQYTSLRSTDRITNRSDASQQSASGQRQAQRLAEATVAAEEEDESFFQGFAHRVKNTVDSFERPAWMEDFPKRPKWMGGMDGNTESSGRAESGRGVGRWFGGRPADGRVRL